MNKDEVLQTIINEFGGMGSFSEKVSIKFLTRFDNGISFQFKGSKKANAARIEIEPTGTYLLKLIKLNGRTKRFESVSEVNDLDGFELVNLFNHITGLNA